MTSYQDIYLSIFFFRFFQRIAVSSCLFRQKNFENKFLFVTKLNNKSVEKSTVPCYYSKRNELEKKKRQWDLYLSTIVIFPAFLSIKCSFIPYVHWISFHLLSCCKKTENKRMQPCNRIYYVTKIFFVQFLFEMWLLSNSAFGMMYIEHRPGASCAWPMYLLNVSWYLLKAAIFSLMCFSFFVVQFYKLLVHDFPIKLPTIYHKHAMDHLKELSNCV